MAGKHNIQREYLSLKELSAYTGICVRTLRDMLNASLNPIPSYRFGGLIRVKRSEFDDWATKSCRIDNGRINQLVDEVLNDLGVRATGRTQESRSRKKN